MMHQEQYRRPRIGFALGDQAGIGPEIVLKLLQRPHLYDLCEPVIIGNFELLCRMARRINPDYLFTPLRPEEAERGRWQERGVSGVPVVDIDGDVDHVILGMVNTAAGWIAYHSIVEGYRLLECGVIEGLILAPVTKEAISKCGCGYHSEYEILAACAGVPETQTIVKGGGLLRASVVGHIPFRDILRTLSTQRVEETGRRLAAMIRSVSGEEPRILAAALNSCEDGALGEEEREIILPALRRLQEEGIAVSGPLPADTLLALAQAERYNGILYMYHDQGNIAMKAQMFQTTACIYTNVPYLILSPGHGSALDIADLGVANPTNISYVLTVLTDLLAGRRQQEGHPEEPSA
jgi:4-hydroxy-L-threonine phosphate dehydrogenase PdxA